MSLKKIVILSLVLALSSISFAPVKAYSTDDDVSVEVISGVLGGILGAGPCIDQLLEITKLNDQLDILNSHIDETEDALENALEYRDLMIDLGNDTTAAEAIITIIENKLAELIAERDALVLLINQLTAAIQQADPSCDGVIQSSQQI